MKAAVYRKYGDPSVFQVEEIPIPAPADDEVQIKIVAVSATTGDARLRAMNLPPGFSTIGRLIFGVFGPRNQVLGVDYSGVVSAVGKNVRDFKVGDEVFGEDGMRMRTYAEYCVRRTSTAIALKPENASFEEAAAICFGGLTALSFLQAAKIQPGETILIVGASGAVGSAAVQLAKRHFGAHVIGVCSAANADLVLSLGADSVIDYTKENAFGPDAKNKYDLVMDTQGVAGFGVARDSLKPTGRLLMVLSGLGAILGSLWVNLTSSKKIISGPFDETKENAQILAQLVQEGAYKPVVDRVFQGLESMPEAHRVVDSGRKKGNVVIRVQNAA